MKFLSETKSHSNPLEGQGLDLNIAPCFSIFGVKLRSEACVFICVAASRQKAAHIALPMLQKVDKYSSACLFFCLFSGQQQSLLQPILKISRQVIQTLHGVFYAEDICFSRRNPRGNF